MPREGREEAGHVVPLKQGWRAGRNCARWRRGQECSLRANMQGADGRWRSKAPHRKKRVENDSLNIPSGWKEPADRQKLEMQSRQGNPVAHGGCGAVTT